MKFGNIVIMSPYFTMFVILWLLNATKEWHGRCKTDIENHIDLGLVSKRILNILGWLHSQFGEFICMFICIFQTGQPVNDDKKRKGTLKFYNFQESTEDVVYSRDFKMRLKVMSCCKKSFLHYKNLKILKLPAAWDRPD